MEYVKQVLLHKTQNSFVQFIRYGFVAAIALTVDFGSLVFLKEVMGLHYIIAATFSFILGLATNYVLSILWVFHSPKVNNRKFEFLFFAIIGIAGLIMTDVLLWLFTSKLDMYYMVSKLVTVVIVYIWNFGMRKKLLFN